jgi:glycosyltransferase involved in cell wall biosynthesis
VIALVHGADAYGAVEEYAAAIARALRAREREAVLLHPDVEALEPFAALAGGSVRVERFPAEVLGEPSLRLARKLAGRLRGLHADVVHVVDAWAVAQVAARLAGARLLVTHHTPELRRRFGPAGRLWWRLGWLVRPEVVYTSETDRSRDGRRLLRTHVVPLAVDLDRLLAVTPSPHAGAVVGNVARLVEQKGHRDLLAALARVPDARLVLVGEGPLRPELERLAASLGIGERVEFLGHRDDVPELLAGFDVFAFPSLFEGLCLAVIEAQAAGVPVVATPVGGIRETVIDGQTGLLVPPHDPAALAAGIARLLADPEEARRLARAARAQSARFSLERMVEATLALYERGAR